MFEPRRGYYKFPVIVLDFESLYPNCISNKNMSNETRLTAEEAELLPPEHVSKIEIRDDDETVKRTCYFYN